MAKAGMSILPTTLAYLLLAGAAEAEPREIASYTLYATGPTDGYEHIPAWKPGSSLWFSPETGSRYIAGSLPDQNFWVIGASLTMQYPGVPPERLQECEAMAGLAGAAGDYLIPKTHGPGTFQIMFPVGHAMKLVRGGHIDIHAGCNITPLGRWIGTLTIWTIP